MKTGAFFAAFLLAAVATHAQSRADAAALIPDVAAAARSAKSWVVEGRRTFTVSGARPSGFSHLVHPEGSRHKGSARDLESHAV